MDAILLHWFFSLLSGLSTVADAQSGPNAVDLAHTNLQAKPLSQRRLKSRTWQMGSLPALLFQKDSCGSAKFARMTMPPIGERRLPMFAHCKPEPIGIGLTDLQSSRGFGPLP
jgi:hypothetical protein